MRKSGRLDDPLPVKPEMRDKGQPKSFIAAKFPSGKRGVVAAVERARKKCGGVKMLIRGTGGILALSPFSNSESAVPAKQNPLAFRGRGVVRGSCTFTFISDVVVIGRKVGCTATGSTERGIRRRVARKGSREDRVQAGGSS
jgi:hypothetical protein